MENSEPGKFTLNEILSQPDSWKATLERLQTDWNGRLPNLKNYEHIIFTGCGSTHYLSIWAARLLQSQLGISSQALPASELWYSPNDYLNPHQRILLIPVSRSGETTETLHAIDEFKKTSKGDVLAITCYPESQLVKKSTTSISTPEGKEQSVAQTRSFSNMMLAALALINRGVPDGMSKQLFESTKVFFNQYLEKAKTIGRDSCNSQFFFLGNGALYGLANEAMLKMKEMSLSYSEAYHFMEFRHGPMSMVNTQSLVIGLLSPIKNNYEHPVLVDMKKLGGVVLALGQNVNPQASQNETSFDLKADTLGNWLYPMYLPLLQIMAYERSLSKGLNPDKPENLTAVVEL